MHFAKKLQEVCSKEGERRPTGREQSVMSRSGTCSSKSGERHVRIVKRDRQNPVNILKRSAFGRGDDLIISTSMLKKTRTDDIVSQVRQKVVERREIEVKRRDRRRSHKCWVPGCVGDARYLKAHACYDHIPSIIDERLEPTDERVLRGRRNALKQAGRWLLRRPVELDELVAFMVVQKMLSPTGNTEISKRQERTIEEFCKFLHEPVPDMFEMEPCNSTGVLLHWKALLLIAASLGEEEREYWQRTFIAPEDAELQEIQSALPVRVYPDAMDAHIHMDRTLRDISISLYGK